MIMKRFYHAILACGVFAAVVAAVSCTKDATGGGGGGYNGEPEVNHDMDGILRRNYLWNEEYATLSPDFGLPYDEFLGDVLMRMKTNDLDKKFRNGRWQLYSNIQRLSPVSRVALSADIDSQFPKEPVYGFGIVSLAIISYTDNGGAETGQYGFAVMAVYPDSPMARAGLGRGTIINQVDGQWITAGNLNTVYSKLLAPNGAATLSVADNQGGFGVSEHKLTAELIYENPVLYRDVLEYGEHKIGYLVYASFDAAFDGELLDALQAFKDAGINDLILDLRLNGGGYVMSSRMLASCIAGARCEGQVFQYYRYNDARMEYPEMTAGRPGRLTTSRKSVFTRSSSTAITGEPTCVGMRWIFLGCMSSSLPVRLRRAKPLSMLCGESDSKWCWSGRRPTAKMWGWRVSIWRMERTNTSSCRSLSRDITPGSKRWTRTVLRRML